MKAADLLAMLPAGHPNRARIEAAMHPKNKYGVAPKDARTVDGITFDSKKEANHYRHLCQMRDEGHVTYFLRQVPLHLSTGPRPAKYVCDFLVFYPDKHHEYHDVKGMRLASFVVKKKVAESIFPIKIREV